MSLKRATREEVYAVLNGERDYQDFLSPTSETAGEHTVAEWLLYIGDYIREAQSVASRTWGPEATIKCLDIIRKVGAMCVACMEQNGVVPRSEAWKVIPR